MTPLEAAQQGLAAHRAGRLVEAESLYGAALKLQPDFHPALHLTGLLRVRQQDFAAAHQYFTRAIAAAPPNAMAALFADRGEALRQMDRTQEALWDFDQALAANPGLVATWNNRGLALSALKRFDEALASFDRALALSPQSPEAHNNRGDTLRELRRYDEALKSFDRALAINPADWGSLNNRAIALTFMGRIDEALASYTRALALEPNIPAALHASAEIFSGAIRLSWVPPSPIWSSWSELGRIFPLGAAA